MYRGVDDVMNALNPAFIKHKLFMVPEVMEQSRERRTTGKGGELIYSVCKVRYTFFAEDGSSVHAVVIGEGMDSGDKASNKAMAVAFKNAVEAGRMAFEAGLGAQSNGFIAEASSPLTAFLNEE